MLMSAFIIAQLVATLIAVYANWGFANIKGCSWGWAGVIWLYSVVFNMPLDLLKFAIRYILSGMAWDNLLENRTAFTTKEDYGKEEEAIELVGSLGKSDVLNSELDRLEQELSNNNAIIDAFGMYLYGIVLHERGEDSSARDVLVKSVDGYPWYWNAWLELQALCSDMRILNSFELMDHWMKEYFLQVVIWSYTKALKVWKNI